VVDESRDPSERRSAGEGGGGEMSAGSPESAVTPIGRMAGPLAMAAAVLIVVEQLIGLARVAGGAPEDDEISEFVQEPLSSVYAALELLGFALLLLALVGLYERQRNSAARLGAVGFFVAFLGTLLAAGDWWFELFATPFYADLAPRAVEADAGGSLLTGGSITFSLFALGWVLFGIASLRARVFPRPAAVMLIIGGVVGYLAGFPPMQMPLAIVVGWIGYWLYKSDRTGSVRPAAVR
jgi:hypothetical protein